MTLSGGETPQSRSGIEEDEKQLETSRSIKAFQFGSVGSAKKRKPSG